MVVPAHNSAGSLANCLKALAAQTIVGDGEIIVVDDGSTDGTADMLRRLTGPRLRVITIDHSGPAAARNAGAAAAAEIVLFTDADCEPEPNWVEEMLAPFRDPSVIGVKGVYQTDQTALLARFVQAEYEDKYARLERVQRRHGRIDFVDTSSAGYRREVLLAIGGFDEAFRQPSTEDVDLSYRLAGSGHRIVFAPAAVVRHRHATTIWAWLARKARYA